MKRLAILLGDNNRSWFVSAIIIAALFGIAHTYQGLSGVLATGIIGFCFGLIFMRNRQNLLLLVLIHGIYDMIGLTLLYLGKERLITDFMQSFLQ